MSLRSGIILAFGAFLLLYLLVPRGGGKGFPGPIRRGSSLEEIRIFQVAGGSDRWELRARRADLSDDSKSADLEGVELDMRESPGMFISGDTGQYRFDAGDLELQGRVSIRGPSWVLRTESAQWDNESGRLTSQDPVRMEGKSFHLTGSGLDIDAEKQIARTNDVTCTFTSY